MILLSAQSDQRTAAVPALGAEPRPDIPDHISQAAGTDPRHVVRIPCVGANLSAVKDGAQQGGFLLI